MRQKLIILASLIGICGFFIYLSCCDDCPTCGICGFFIYLSCCDDCPTCPADPVTELGNYRLYAVDGLFQFLMSVDVPADTIVDSIRLDYYPSEVFVTPDGSKLIVMGGGGLVYNTSDLSLVAAIITAY